MKNPKTKKVIATKPVMVDTINVAILQKSTLLEYSCIHSEGNKRIVNAIHIVMPMPREINPARSLVIFIKVTSKTHEHIECKM